MKIALTMVAVLSFAAWVSAQTSQQSKPAASAPAKRQPAKKDPPTLGFNHIKDVPPIIDSDAMTEGQKLEKELPKNEFVHSKEAMHETILMNEFVEGFKNSKECNGITFYLKTDKKPNFTVQISVMGHDDLSFGGQTWTWILGYPSDPGSAGQQSPRNWRHGNSNNRQTHCERCLYDRLGRHRPESF